MSEKWENTPFKGPMARARGLGSAHTGLSHWMGQKITALANIPLVLWAVWSFTSLVKVGASRIDVIDFFAHTHNAVLMILFLTSAFYHVALGLQVVIEDYVHCKVGKPAMLIGIKLAVSALYIASVFSVLKIAL